MFRPITMWTFYRTHAHLVRVFLVMSLVLVSSVCFLSETEAAEIQSTTSSSLTLTVYPTTVENKGLALLVWKAPGATNCKLNDGTKTESVKGAGSVITPALTQNTTYTLSCTLNGTTVSTP